MPEPAKPPLPQISLVATAFGAVAGIVTSFVFEPLTGRIPVPLVADFLKELIKPFLIFAVAVFFGYVASRIQRLDKFLNHHIGYAAPIASAVLALSAWMRAGTPAHVFAILSVLLIAGETYIFLLFCAYMVELGMAQIAKAQEAEYMSKRESEAQDITMEAIAEGAPDAAAAMFGLNLAGQWGAAVVNGCYLLLMSGFHFVAIWTAVSLAAYALYGVAPVWSIAAGLVMSLAAMRTTSASLELGEQYAHQIPVDEKYRPIRGEREP